MSLPLIVVSVLGAAFCGYCLGRCRPYYRLGGWAIDRIRFGGWWHATKPRLVTLLAVWALTCPREAVNAWRDRPRPTVARATPLTHTTEETR